MLGLFAYIGAFATMGLYFVAGDSYLLGGVLFLIANLSFGASIVFYNAFLPDIASPDQARAYVAELQAIIRALDVGDAKMEEGSLRVDANVSVRPAPAGPHGTT